MTDAVRNVGVPRRAEAGPAAVGTPFDLATKRSDHGAVVKISGDLVFSTGPRLRDELVSLADRGTPSIPLDLVDVTSIDSTAWVFLSQASSVVE